MRLKGGEGGRGLHLKKPITRGLRTPRSSGVALYQHDGLGLDAKFGSLEKFALGCACCGSLANLWHALNFWRRTTAVST